MMATGIDSAEIAFAADIPPMVRREQNAGARIFHVQPLPHFFRVLLSAANAPGRMRLETLGKTGHAESEAAAYAKGDAWRWLLR